MRIAVMGAGAVGAYFGAQLAESGAEVHFIARGPHLDALRARGLEIITAAGSRMLAPVNATDDPASIGVVDLVLFCVKLYDCEAAARACLPLLGPDSCVLTLQNGVDSVDLVAPVAGAERVLGGVTYIVASIEAPGVIRRTGDWARIDFAEQHGRITPRSERLLREFRAAGIDSDLKTDLRQLLWSKFVLLSATSATTALTRQTIGVIRTDPIMRMTAHACISETLRVGRALGIELGEDLEKAARHRFEHEMSDDAKASQLVDLEHGKPLELEYLSGTVHRLGQQVGVPTPVHTTVYAALRPFVGGAQARRGH
jgi:2-dehydropantoate 2-reductase